MLLIRNLRNSWLKLGRDIWLPPGAVVELTEKQYERNKDFIKRAHRNDLIELVGEVADNGKQEDKVGTGDVLEAVKVNEVVDGTVEQATANVHDDATEDVYNEVAEDIQDNTKTIVGEYLEGDMHWKTAEKALKQIDDTDKLERLLDEARGAGLKDDHVLIRLINARLEELGGE